MKTKAFLKQEREREEAVYMYKIKRDAEIIKRSEAKRDLYRVKGFTRYERDQGSNNSFLVLLFFVVLGAVLVILYGGL